MLRDSPHILQSISFNLDYSLNGNYMVVGEGGIWLCRRNNHEDWDLGGKVKNNYLGYCDGREKIL